MTKDEQIKTQQQTIERLRTQLSTALRERDGKERELRMAIRSLGYQDRIIYGEKKATAEELFNEVTG